MAALCVARYGWVYVDEAHTVHAVWEFLEYVGNTVVFMLAAVWKSKFHGAFVLNRVVLHAKDATPARWRGDAGSSPLDGASMHPTHWLMSTQVSGKSDR